MDRGKGGHTADGHTCAVLVVVCGEANMRSRVLTTSTTYSHAPPSTSASRCAKLNSARSAAMLRGVSVTPSPTSSVVVSSCGCCGWPLVLAATDAAEPPRERELRGMGHGPGHVQCVAAERRSVHATLSTAWNTGPPGMCTVAVQSQQQCTAVVCCRVHHACACQPGRSMQRGRCPGACRAQQAAPPHLPLTLTSAATTTSAWPVVPCCASSSGWHSV